MPKQSKSKSGKARSPLQTKRSYTLRDLPLKQQTNVRKYLLELQDKADDLESLKRPGEMWYFTLFGNRSRLFDTLELAAPQMIQWAMSAQTPQHGSQAQDDVIHGIKLFKFKGRGVTVDQELSDTDFEETEQQFSRIRQRAREKRKMEKAEIFERAKKKLAPAPKKQGEERPSTTSLLKSAMDKLAAAAKEMRAMQRKLDKLAKQVTPKKQASKKKSTPKKGGKKTNDKRTGSKSKNTQHTTSPQIKRASSTKSKGKTQSKRKTGKTEVR